MLAMLQPGACQVFLPGEGTVDSSFDSRQFTCRIAGSGECNLWRKRHKATNRGWERWIGRGFRLGAFASILSALERLLTLMWFTHQEYTDAEKNESKIETFHTAYPQ
jgi:hypothetical protein